MLGKGPMANVITMHTTHSHQSCLYANNRNPKNKHVQLKPTGASVIMGSSGCFRYTIECAIQLAYDTHDIVSSECLDVTLVAHVGIQQTLNVGSAHRVGTVHHKCEICRHHIPIQILFHQPVCKIIT